MRAVNWFEREKKLMRRLRLRPQPGSGNTFLKPQDGENGAYLAQLKSTQKGSIVVKRQDVLELCHDAAVAHKVPLFLLDINGMVLVCVRAEHLDDFIAVQQDDNPASIAYTDYQSEERLA